MRILLTADWHLGKLFHGLHLTEDQALLLEGEFLPLVKDLRPDLVVLAGDVFDRPVPPAEAVALFGEILTRLHETGTRVLVLSGNHDSPERLAFARELLSRLAIFLITDERTLFEPLRLNDAHGPVAFYVAPHLSPPALREALARRGLSPPEGGMEIRDLWQLLWENISWVEGRRVFCGHLLVEGGAKGDSETSLWIGGEEALPAAWFQNFDLVLLGHLHRPQQPLAHIFYPGSPLPLSFSESLHSKGVVFIELGPGGEIHFEHLLLTPPREFRVLEGYFEELLRHSPTKAYVKVILKDTQPIPEAAERLRRIFPYLLCLETPHLKGIKGEIRPPDFGLQLRPEDLFSQFLLEVAGRSPTKEELHIFQEISQTS